VAFLSGVYPLVCITCHDTEEERKEKARAGKTDQLKWAVPYVPVEDEPGAAWAYTMVPAELAAKWKALPF